MKIFLFVEFVVNVEIIFYTRKILSKNPLILGLIHIFNILDV